MSRPSMFPGRPGPSGAPYIAGIVVLAALTGGLLWWRSRGEAPPPAPPAPAAAVSSSEPSKLPDFAPPPPPPTESAATTVASAQAPEKSGKSGGRAPDGVCSGCGQGVTTGALNAAVQSRAGTAQGCYNRGLRQGGAEGKVTVSVSIGNDGSACGVSVVNDTLGNSAITSCIVGKFQGGGYPKPQQGCVVITVPIAFKMR